jgi:hypothetical protein
MEYRPGCNGRDFFYTTRFGINNCNSFTYFVSFPHLGTNLDNTPIPVYIYRPPGYCLASATD